MLKYVSKLSNVEIANILSLCSLKPITFKDKPAIKRTKKQILVTCIDTESIFYKTIIEWTDKHNKYGDIILSYVDKSYFDNFILISINDFQIKSIKKSILKLKTSNNDLNIQLNSIFLNKMIEKFKDSNYFDDLKNFNLSLKFEKSHSF